VLRPCRERPPPPRPRRPLELAPPRRRRGHAPLDPAPPAGRARRHRAAPPEARAAAHHRPRDGRDPPRGRRLRARRRGRPRARRAGADDPSAAGLTMTNPQPLAHPARSARLVRAADGAAADRPAGASTLLTDISELWTLDPALDDPARPGGVTGDQVLRDAALVIEDGRIAWTGPASEAPPADAAEDLGGRAVLPGWVDSHSHLVFDGDRAAEFEARMAGQSYSAGGIGVTTDATRSASDERLRTLVRGRIAEAVAGGTTCLE